MIFFKNNKIKLKKPLKNSQNVAKISSNNDKLAKIKPLQKKDPKLKYVLEIMKYGKWKMILGTKRFKGL